MNNFYQPQNYSYPTSLNHSFAQFPPQSSTMSVEEQIPQNQEMVQSKLVFQENPQNYEQSSGKQSQMFQRPNENHSTHKRMSSWQQTKSFQQQSQCKSLCTSPQRLYKIEEQENYHYQPCPCELQQLWQEFLELRLMQRKFRRPGCCHHQRGCYITY